MNKKKFDKLVEKSLKQVKERLEDGKKEYARRDDNVFANFDRVAERRRLNREEVLMVYIEKHLDGIHAWVDGHHSQRESVEERILDAIAFLILGRAMAVQRKENNE